MALAHKITCVYVIYHSPSIAEQLKSYQKQITVYVQHKRGNNYCYRFKTLIALHVKEKLVFTHQKFILQASRSFLALWFSTQNHVIRRIALSWLVGARLNPPWALWRALCVAPVPPPVVVPSILFHMSEKHSSVLETYYRESCLFFDFSAFVFNIICQKKICIW